jgi:transcriptional regulator with XRE-family HTH domain
MRAVARTPAQRGDIGNWLRESRLARGYTSQAAARREIERLTGWRIAQSVYAEWESGRRVPEGNNRTRLEEFYGPLPDPSVPVGDQAAVAAAIREQTDVIRELVSAIGRLDHSVSGGLIGLGEVLGPVLFALGGKLPQTEPEPAGPHDPDERSAALPNNPKGSAR